MGSVVTFSFHLCQCMLTESYIYFRLERFVKHNWSYFAVIRSLVILAIILLQFALLVKHKSTNQKHKSLLDHVI